MMTSILNDGINEYSLNYYSQIGSLGLVYLQYTVYCVVLLN